jgi:uncharacterized protein (TIGR02246 family)
MPAKAIMTRPNLTPTLDANDERDVRALLERMRAAWGHGDGVAYAACFCETSDYVTYNGMHLRGRAENARFHGALFKGVLKGSRLSADILAMELLAADVAVAHTTGTGRKRSYQTYVLVRREGAWLIRSFQNTRVRPFSAWVTQRLAR